MGVVKRGEVMAADLYGLKSYVDTTYIAVPVISPRPNAYNAY